jgi:hypothetical protein
MQHSLIGGSTAKIALNCYGALKLREKMPPQAENEYMAKGTLCHSAIDLMLNGGKKSQVMLMKYAGIQMDEDTYEAKVGKALELLDEIDPNKEMEYATESRVSFGDALPGVFGTTDLIGKINGRAVVLDWKFGDGVPVDAEENDQLMFYAAAAMRTPETQWAFQDADEVEMIIVQPPHVRRWTTTIDRIMVFEQELFKAVKAAQHENAPLKHGEHCRFCSAKPVCPKMTGAVDRALQTKIADLDVKHIDAYLKNADLLEDWIKDIRALAFEMLDNGAKLPSWKLVAKRGSRKWAKDASTIASALRELGIDPWVPDEVLSPAQAEKALKKVKQELPADLVVSVSSGSTLAPMDDPRPEVLQIGQQLTAALSKIV